MVVNPDLFVFVILSEVQEDYGHDPCPVSPIVVNLGWPCHKMNDSTVMM